MIEFNDKPDTGLDFYENNVKIPPETAKLRAEKMSYAMGENSPGIPQIQNDIILGKEDTLRQGFAAVKQAEIGRQQVSLLQDIASSDDRGAEAVEIARSLTQDIVLNPQSVVEKSYAERLLSDLYFTPSFDKSIIDLSFGVKPHETNILLDIASDEIAKAEIIKKISEDLNLDYGEASTQTKVTDFIEQFVPFFTWYNVADDVDLMGSNLRDQVSYLHSLPLDEFQREVSTRVKAIAKENLHDARMFLSAVYNYSDTDAAWGNIQSGMDIADVLPIGLLAKGLRGTVRGLKATKGVSLPDAIASTGKSVDAVVARGLEIAQREKIFFQEIDSLVRRDPTKGVKDLIEEVPSFSNPFSFFMGESFREGARELADRILPKALDLATTAVRSLGDRTAIERLGEAAVKQAVDIGVRQARKEFTHLNDAIIDITHVPSETSPISNIDSLGIHFGTPSGELFDSPERAEYFAKMEYKLPDYEIEMQGEGAKIVVYRDINESLDTVKDAIIQTGNTTPELGLISGYMRSAADTLPSDMVEAGKVLVHGVQENFEALRNIAQPIVDLPKGSKGRFERFLTDARDFVSWEGKTYQRGKEFNTLPEFEEEWVNSFGVLPTDQEALAYFSYKKLGEWDYFLRNLSIYSAKARLGIRNFSIKVPRPEGKALTMGDVVSGRKGATDSKAFEGRQLDSIDFSSKDDAGVLFWDPDGGHTILAKRKDFDTDAITALDELLKGNHIVIQVASPYSLPLKGDTGVKDIVNFVVTSAYKSERLSYKQIPYRPGGHVAYDYPYFIKQGRSMWAGDKAVYTGDVTIRPANTLKDAQEYTYRLETARKLLKDKRMTEFADYVNSNLPEDASNLKKRFDDGDLSLDVPIAYVRKGARTLDVDLVKNHFGNLEDSFRDPLNLLRDVNKEFAGERNVNVSGVLEEGTEIRPMFELQTPRLVDPLTIANRAAANLARNAYLEDYRILAANHFVEEFAGRDVFTVSKDVMRNNPVAFLFKPSWNEKTTNPKALQAAKNFQRAFTQLMGTPTDLQRGWARAKEKLYDSLHTNVSEKTADLGYDMMVGRLDDPVTFARKSAFELKLGLFNPVQLWKQAQTFSIAVAVAPQHAVRSSFGAIMMRMLSKTNNKDIINWYAKKATIFGWKKEDFLEAYDHMQRTGILRVEGEHAWSDDMLDPKLYTTTVGKVLDKGKVFFREGERFTRLAAYNTAYLEWKKANPGKLVDRKALQSILVRQDNLTANMTRASNASWQNVASGALSIPTQFYTYQTRMMELMLGKRLSTAEKTRVLLLYSAMYGVPVGVLGTAAGIYPWYEDIRQATLERGMDFPNEVAEVMHKGIVSTLLHLATGKEYDWGEAYGPSGISVFKDMFFSDATTMDILLGASGSTFSELTKTAIPLYESLAQVIREPSEGGLKVLQNDFIDFARNISSVNNAMKMYYAINQSKYISKTEGYTADVDAVDGIFMGIFGFGPQNIDDLSAFYNSNRSRKESVDFAEKQMVKYLRRWADETDDETRAQYLKMVKVWMISGDIPATEYGRIVREAAQGGYESTFQSMNWNFFVKHAPPSQAEQRLEYYKRNN